MRWIAIAAVVLVLPLAAAPGAAAHTTGIHTGFVSTISGIEPELPGLLVRVIGGHERLSVQNWTQQTVVLFDEKGAVAARLAPGERAAWADPRIAWEGPPPDGETLLKNWRIEGEADGKPFAIVGFLGYRPPPAAEPETGAGGSGWPRWATFVALAGGAVLALAALALPLLRRKGEGESESATGS